MQHASARQLSHLMDLTGGSLCADALWRNEPDVNSIGFYGYDPESDVELTANQMPDALVFC